MEAVLQVPHVRQIGGALTVHIRVILVGRVKDAYLREGMAEYVKRLRPYAKAEVVEIQDEPVPESLSPKQEEAARDAEGARVLRALRALHPSEYLVALDLQGQEMSSVEFSRWLQERGTAGDSNLAFAIGGTTGLSDKVLSAARLRLSMGRMTFLHQFMPLLVLEQVYRAFKIAAGEPYHR